MVRRSNNKNKLRLNISRLSPHNKFIIPRLSITNIAGLSSLILFAALGYVALTPRLMDEAVATEYCKGDNGYVVCDATATVDTYAHVASVVSLGVQSNVVMDVVPKSTGVVTETPVSLRVSTNSPEGYSLYMKTLGSTNALTSINGDHSEISPIDGQVAFSSLSSQDNVWGYAIGSDNTEKIYQAVPTTQEQAIYATDHLVVDGGDNVVDLSFASNITTSLPAGTYSNSVLISAVANPVTITNLSELVFMQDMTHDICANTADYVDLDHYVTKQLIDTRDGNKYWVSKLADGNCWMVQNLGLDITEAGLKTSDSDILSDWDITSTYPPTSTTIAPSDGNGKAEFLGVQGDIGSSNTFSWNFGQVVFTKPFNNLIQCENYEGGAPNKYSAKTTDNFGEVCRKAGFLGVSDSEWQPTFAAQMGDYNYDVDTNTITTIPNPTGETFITVDTTTKTYDAHYLVGNYYQFNTATAGTGSSTANSGDVKGSICPKNWQLPTSGRQSNYLPLETGNFYKLLLAYGYPEVSGYTTNENNNRATTILDGTIDSPDNIAAPPISLVRAGTANIVSGYLVSTGTAGIVRSATIQSPATVYNLVFYSSKVFPSYANNPVVGYNVRCLAR